MDLHAWLRNDRNDSDDEEEEGGDRRHGTRLARAAQLDMPADPVGPARSAALQRRAAQQAQISRRPSR